MTSATENVQFVVRESTKIMKGIQIFLDRGDEVSIQIFKECMQEAFEE